MSGERNAPTTGSGVPSAADRCECGCVVPSNRENRLVCSDCGRTWPDDEASDAAWSGDGEPIQLGESIPMKCAACGKPHPGFDACRDD